MLEIKNLYAGYGKEENIIKDINFKVNENDFFIILGPNGAGKTTILKSISQNIDYTGEILFNNQNIKHISTKDRAKIIGVLLQRNYVTYSYTVREIVELGLYSKSYGFFEKSLDKDYKEELIYNAILETGLSGYENRSVLTLSGGEIQRVFLAQVLVQDPDILVLDEPTNHLDYPYQEKIFEIVDNFRKKDNKSVIAVIHDLKIARYYGDKAILLKDGKTIGYGDIEDVMSKDLLKKAYDMDIHNWMNRLNKKWE